MPPVIEKRALPPDITLTKEGANVGVGGCTISKVAVVVEPAVSLIVSFTSAGVWIVNGTATVKVPPLDATVEGEGRTSALLDVIVYPGNPFTIINCAVPPGRTLEESGNT